MAAMPTTHHRACTLCEAGCGLAITVDDGRVVDVRGDVDDPFSRGYLCPKGVALQDLVTDPDRLRTPVRRRPDGGWDQIGWAEAIDEVAERLCAIVDRDGPDAVTMYLGNPITHGWAPVILIPQLLSALGVRSRYSAASVDQQPQHLLSLLLFGSPLLLPVPDIDRTDLLVVVGGNPLVSNGSIMTAPDMRRRLRDLRARGGRCIVIDPRRTPTADAADEHIAIRPGTDLLLLAAVAHVIYRDGLVRPGRAGQYVDGIAAVGRMVEPVTPERAAAATGIPAERIESLAHQIASARRGVVYGRLGLCQTDVGTAAYWLVHVLNIITGRLDAPGGWMFSTPAFDLPVLGDVATDLVGYDRWRSRVRGIPEFSSEFPVATLPDEILTPGPGRVRGLVLYAGNPARSAPDSARMEQALADLEFCVAVDYYVTESSRHADIILPPVTPLEREEFDVVFGSVSVRNGVRWGPAVLERDPAAKDDADILIDLLEAVEKRRRGPVLARAAGAVRRAVLPKVAVAAALRVGPHRLRWRRVRDAGHGLDLGPLRPGLPGRLQVPRIRLDHPVVVADWERAVQTAETRPAGLLLIGRRHLRTNNSWMLNLPRLTRGEIAALEIHPSDAAELGISTGDAVEMTGAGGVVTAIAEVTDRVCAGVVCLPHGFGHDAEGTWAHARSVGGPNVNAVHDGTIDPVSGNAAVTGRPVEVRRLDNRAPRHAKPVPEPASA